MSRCEYLKGRDRLVAIALERAGLEPRVVPYVFETCAGDSWRLRRDVSAREKQIFAQKRLKGSSLERKLGQTEYSATDYFGNEASDVSFYAAAAILFDVPPKSARKRVAGE